MALEGGMVVVSMYREPTLGIASSHWACPLILIGVGLNVALPFKNFCTLPIEHLRESFTSCVAMCCFPSLVSRTLKERPACEPCMPNPASGLMCSGCGRKAVALCVVRACLAIHLHVRLKCPNCCVKVGLAIAGSVELARGLGCPIQRYSMYSSSQVMPLSCAVVKWIGKLHKKSWIALV